MPNDDNSLLYFPQAQSSSTQTLLADGSTCQMTSPASQTATKSTISLTSQRGLTQTLPSSATRVSARAHTPGRLTSVTTQPGLWAWLWPLSRRKKMWLQCWQTASCVCTSKRSCLQVRLLWLSSPTTQKGSGWKWTATKTRCLFTTHKTVCTFSHLSRPSPRSTPISGWGATSLL